MSIDPPPQDQFTRVSPASAGDLRIQMPDGSLRQFPILTSTVSIGRAPENDLVLDDVTVSRQHARLTLEQGHLYLEDLGSSNGTFWENQRLSPGQRVEFDSGQSLEFGQVKAVFQRFGAAPARPRSRAGSTSRSALDSV